MKKQKKLLIMVAVLAVLVGAILIIKNADLENGLDTNGDEVESGEAIFGFEKEDPTALSWTYGDYSVSLVKEDDTWKDAEDEAFPVDQDKVEEFTEFLGSAKSDMIIENVSDLKQYGLTSPRATLNLTVNDTEYPIKIGNENDIGGEYYLTFDDTNVYLIDDEIIDDLSRNIEDFLKKEDTPDTSDLKDLTIVRGDETLAIVYEEDGADAYSDQYHYFAKNGSSLTTLDNELAESFTSSAGTLTLGDCVDYDAADHLKDYGLAEPDATVTVNYVEHTQVETGETDKNGDAVTEEQTADKTFVYEIGHKDKSYYLRLQDSSIVYSLTESLYNTIMETEADDMLPNEVVLFNFDDVSEVSFTLDGETFTLTSTSKGSGEDKTVTWKLDGEEVDPETIFSDLNSMTITKRETEKSNTVRNAELEITICRDGKDDTVVTFYKYTAGSSVADFDGDDSLIVSRDDVTSLISEINTLVLPADEEE